LLRFFEEHFENHIDVEEAARQFAGDVEFAAAPNGVFAFRTDI
jgi:hypothetical protein